MLELIKVCIIKNNIDGEFKLIEGMGEQTWSLVEIDGELFCGHNKGTFYNQWF